MDALKDIRIWVERADIFICSLLRWLAAVLPLTAILLTVLLFVWAHRPDPYLIDYDAPGIDITSEGPEDGDPWYDEGW